MKIQIYPNPKIDLREIDWENDKIKIIDHLTKYGCIVKPVFEKYYISITEIKNNTIFYEISIK